MSLTADEFLADVAAVYTGGPLNGAFGSGRLIAPGLILTAGHVVDYPSQEAPTRSGWKVCLLRNRTREGSWTVSAHTAEVIWRGTDDLDLALLRLSDDMQLGPALTPVFASYDLVGPIAEVDAAGFPQAWFDAAGTVRDYTVRGILRIASQLGPYAWSVPPADKPDDPRGWKGMSGAAACRIGPDDKLYLFGAVQEVPANFSHGQLEVARLSNGFDDAEFRGHLRVALSADPRIAPFRLGQSRSDLGIASIFQARTRAFTDEYLVSEAGPVPFGGRDLELERLNAWLLDPNAPPRMLVTAPAGRGKSALLVQWMKILQSGGVVGPNGWQLAFMPISIRVETNRPEIFYEGLARRLAEIAGEALPSEAIRDAGGFRYGVRDLLDRMADSDRRVIIIIDGLDEALHGSFDPAILPAVLPPNLRVLLSARWEVGDSNSKGWLKRLGWDRGIKVDSFELDRLKARGIADVLVKLSAPIDIAVREPDLVERLVELTEGEPLLVRYYAEDLWQVGSKGAVVTRADLDLMKPGFDSYFERWFDRQEELWTQEKAGIDRDEVDRVLAVLAFALGPLGEADLLELMKHIHGRSGVMAADRLLKPLRRFVFGDGKKGSGYVLSHPKIGGYLQRERFAASAAVLRRGFAAWGQAHLGELNAGRVQPERASSYALQFLPQHLDDAGASPEDFMMMVEDGWRLAWEKFEGGQRGFASAVQSAWSAQRKNADLRLGAQWRCALALSSIRSLGQNVPERLALVAVQRGVLTFRQAAYFAEITGPSKESVELLAGLAVAARENHALSAELALSALATARAARDDTEQALLLSAAIEILFSVDPGLAPEQRADIAGEALAAAKAIARGRRRDGFDEMLASAMASWRSRALATLAPHLAPARLGEALISAITIHDADARSRALAALAPHLAPAQLGEALAAAKAIDDEEVRSSALAALAPLLTPEQTLDALGAALAAAEAIWHLAFRSRALAALAPLLLPEQLGEALAAAKAIDTASLRSHVLIALAPLLAPEQLGDALASATAIGDERERSSILAALAPLLAPEQPGEALASAKTIDNANWRWRVLATLAPHLAPEQLGEALASAKAIGDASARSSALAALAPHLALEQRHDVIGEALAAAKAIGDASSRSSALAALAPSLAPEQLGDALAAAKAIDHVYWRSLTLAALAPHLTREQLGEALAATRPIGDNYARSGALAALAPLLAPALRHDVAGEALAAAKAISDENNRSKALAVLAPYLAPAQLGDALVAAMAIDDERWRSGALAALAPSLAPEQLGDALASAKAIDHPYWRSLPLAALAPLLAPEQRIDVLGEALASATAISDERGRAETLAALAPALTPEQFAEAFASARAIDDKFWRSRALAALGPRLAPEQLGEALTAAKAIVDAYSRSNALAALAPHLAAEQLGEALASAKAVGDGFFRAHALAALAPHLAPTQGLDALGDALAAAKAIRTETDRSNALAALAPHLAPEQLGEALAAAKAIDDAYWRSHALAALAPRLAPEQLGEVLASASAITSENSRSSALAELVGCVPAAVQVDVLLTLIDAVGKVARPTALSAAAAGARPTFDLGGQGAVLELRRAINDVCRWYP
jgi:hypothetical protein